MMTIKTTVLAAALAAASLTFGGTANAAPVGPVGKAVTIDQSLQKVDYRGYRHCHRRHGSRYCHGGAYRRGYYRPGVSLYIGPRWGRHHHRHHRHWRH